MLRNFNQPILGINNEELKEKDIVVTLETVVVNALLTQDPNDTTVTGTEKAKRFTLAMKIHDTKDSQVDITAEEISKIKELVGKYYTALVVGRVYDLLEQKIEEVKNVTV